MTDSRKGSSADNLNDGQAAGTGKMLRSMLIGGFARHGGLEELNALSMPSTSGLCVPTDYRNSVYLSNR